MDLCFWQVDVKQTSVQVADYLALALHSSVGERIGDYALIEICAASGAVAGPSPFLDTYLLSSRVFETLLITFPKPRSHESSIAESTTVALI
jgi:hypothetical protein